MTNRDNQQHVTLSTNSGTGSYEVDVLVYWVNDSCYAPEHRAKFQMDGIQFPFTHAKRAIVIMGSTEILKVYS